VLLLPLFGWRHIQVAQFEPEVILLRLVFALFAFLS
jgi:hypothetical protein